jgi:hypothetical protein
LIKRTGFGDANVVDGYSEGFDGEIGVGGAGRVGDGYDLEFRGCEGEESSKDDGRLHCSDCDYFRKKSVAGNSERGVGSEGVIGRLL